MAKKRKKLLLGVDLGGTKMLVGLFNFKGDLLGTKKIKVDPSKGKKNFLEGFQETVENLFDDEGESLKNLQAVGMGCPGVIDHKKGLVVVSPNIHFLKNFPFVETVKKMLGVPAVIENDVNTGLYGEMVFGAARGFRQVIGAFLGTGVGGALIFDGRLYRGATGAAGEIGHMIINAEGPLCGCGQRGCLEAYVGRVSIAAEAAIAAQRQNAPALFKEVGTEISKIKSGVLEASINKGDRAIEQLIRQRSFLLGRHMAGLVNLLSPELIVLGGGVVEALGKFILPEVKNGIREFAMKPIAKKVKVVSAQLGDYAIIKGAAQLALEKISED